MRINQLKTEDWMHRSAIRPQQYVKYDRFALLTAAKVYEVRYIEQK